MRNLVQVFGDKPQVRLLEASLALAPFTFTRAELASEAGLWKASANRAFPALEELRLVQKVEDGDYPKYRVCEESKLLAVLQVLEPALWEAMRADRELDKACRVVNLFNDRVRDIVTKPVVVSASNKWNSLDSEKTTVQVSSKPPAGSVTI